MLLTYTHFRPVATQGLTVHHSSACLLDQASTVLHAGARDVDTMFAPVSPSSIPTWGI